MIDGVLMIDDVKLKYRISRMFHYHHPCADIAFTSYVNEQNDTMSITVLLSTVEHTRCGVAMNDPAYTTLQLKQVTATTYELTAVNGVSLLVKPKAGSNMAFDSIKIPFRKKTGTLNTVLTALGKFFTKRAEIIDANWSDISGVLQMYKPRL